jgi:ribosomal protein S18 acetylase RimI-like enzyme
MKRALLSSYVVICLMRSLITNDIKIVNTETDDMDLVLKLFEHAMQLQGQNGYKVWSSIDKTGLEKDIVNKLQYKIITGNDVLCIFSVQYNDPLIWRERDQNNAVYLHRIVVNPSFKGQRQFEKVLEWAIHLAMQRNLQFVRMDTWAENQKIIAYYQSFGFKFIENYQTTDNLELPIQNRNLNVALLELKLNNK